MTETQRRIKELKRSLPNMKEKVVAVAVLLALSLTMMASVSYAWYTLSFAPELGGVNTTVAANGNLEIALSDFDGLEPDSSGITDSFAAEGQSVHGANTSWGNLINLSAGYGLEELILRPAKFDPKSLTFLSSMTYGDDGRVEGETTNFAFTSWMYDETLKKNLFGVPEGSTFGVRAISSVSVKADQAAMLALLDEADGLMQDSAEEYQRIMKNPDYLKTIQAVIQVYLNYNMYAKVGSLAGEARNNSEITLHMPVLQQIYDDFYNKAIIKLGDAITRIANIQLLLNGDTSGTPIQRGDLEKEKKYNFKGRGINLGDTLTAYQYLEQQVRNDKKLLADYIANDADGKFYLNPKDPKDPNGDTTILDIVFRLVDVNNALVDGNKVSSLLGSGSTALSVISGLGSTVEVVITKGSAKTEAQALSALYKFEAITGEHMDVTLKKLDLIIKSPNGHLTTNAQGSLFSQVISLTKTMDNNYSSGLTADDTYGMVLDLWFRTNAGEGSGTVLTLNGLPEIQISYERRMFVPSGETEAIPVSVYDRPTAVLEGKLITEEVLVFKKEVDRDGDGEIGTDDYIYYSCTDYEQVNIVNHVNGEIVKTENPIRDSNVSDKMDKIEKVIGFNSANRIWKDGELVMESADEISASQGSGSCYVFYADTPTKAASSLELLSHMKLAFINEAGEMTAQAIMDVEHVYAQAGKYIVPIVIVSSEHVTQDAEGNEILGVSTLRKNVSVRVSVVVYLEGEGLENSMVMSKDEIVGSLNLQFSTTEDLRSMKESALMMDTISLRAELNGGNTATFNYDGTSTFSPVLTAYVQGLTPAKVQAVFTRRINATQGRQMEPITLKNQSGDVWTGNCSFMMPGTYELKSLLVDGVEYPFQNLIELDGDGLKDDYIRVTVTGFALKSVSLLGAETALTTAPSARREVSVSFQGDVDSQPKTVAAYFSTKDGLPVTTKLTRSGDYWLGMANFASSGTYVLDYLILDGEYFEVPADMQESFTAYLGLRAQVELRPEKELQFDYTGLKTFEIYADIVTDNGELLKGFEDVVLRYTKRNGTLESGLTAPLEWKGGQYCGVFNVDEIGVFNFAQMEIGTENTITSAITAPSIIARSTVPPQYLGSDSPKVFVVSGSGRATYTAKLNKESMGADAVFAVFTNPDVKDDKGNLIEHVMPVLPNALSEGENAQDHVTFTFNLPDVNGSQNGVWTLKELRLYGVYDADGKYYGYASEEGEADTYYVLVAHNDDVYTVLNHFDVKVDKATVNSGAAFMESQNLPAGYGVTISAPGVDMSQVNVESVELKLIYSSGSQVHGGYTFTGTLPETTRAVTYILNKDDATGKWIVSANDTIRLAGTYDYEVTIKVISPSGEAMFFTNKSVTNNTADDVLTVKSKKPEVKFTATNPTAGTEFNGINAAEDNNVTRKNVISADQYSVTCYYQGQITDDGCTQACSGYTASKATTTLSNIGTNFTSATCTIISKGEGSNVVFSYAPDKLSDEQAIGNTSGSGSSAKRLGIGTDARATQLVVIGSDGVTYTFILDNYLSATCTE